MRRALLFAAVLPFLAGCGAAPAPLPPAAKAPPQQATLRWLELYPAKQPALVFGVSSFAVTARGWLAHVSVENRSSVSWDLVDPDDVAARAFGLLLLPNGELRELDRLNRDGALPAIREATSYDPPPPKALEPGTTWRGTISGPGALASGLWVRLAFGTLTSRGEPPPGTVPRVKWLTDHAYRLSRRP